MSSVEDLDAIVKRVDDSEDVITIVERQPVLFNSKKLKAADYFD